ncbi:hypothetical protein LJC48_04425 [Desulfovibrio sp. OttesenSCG-928-C06]|nr:hypothetical protein [Desulfovibrio sp. OttesenSCG-928-C06]
MPIKTAIDKALPSFVHYGVDESAGNNIVVSLTSFPERLPGLHYCLYSLLTQSIKPEKLILWLGREQFSGLEADLPASILDLRKNGLEIRWTSDIKQYKKIIPALTSYPDKLIVTADDDIYYRPNWLELLYQDYLDNNKAPMVYAHRVHKIKLLPDGLPLPYLLWQHCQGYHPEPSYYNFPTTGGGNLYPPGTLHEDVLNESRFQELAPFADDLYIWAMAVLKGTKTKIVQDNHRAIIDLFPEMTTLQSSHFTLAKINCVMGKNDEQLLNILNYYPDILMKLVIERKVLQKNRPQPCRTQAI